MSLEPKSGSVVWLGCVLLGAIAAWMLSGCGLLTAPHKVAGAVVAAPGADTRAEDRVLELQQQLQRYADDFLERNAGALDEYARRVGTEEARVQALHTKLYAGTAVISVVSGPNPYANLLDLVAITVIGRMGIQEYWMKQPGGEAYQPWLEANEALETEVWALANQVLSPEEVEQSQQGIAQYYKNNPRVRTGFFARPSQFGAFTRKAELPSQTEASLLGIATLDPTAGLEPAVREATRARLFAERAMFTAQRMPFLLSWQVELLSYNLAAGGPVQTVLTNASRLTQSAERLSRTVEAASQIAEQLPDRFSLERREILSALEQQEGKLKDLTLQVTEMLESGERFSQSLNPTVTNFQALLKQLGVDEARSNVVSEVEKEPFRVLDYAETADRINAVAREVNVLVSNAQQATPQIELLGRGAFSEANRLMERGFRLGLVLILLLLAGAVASGLLYQILVSRWLRIKHRDAMGDQPRDSSSVRPQR